MSISMQILTVVVGFALATGGAHLFSRYTTQQAVTRASALEAPSIDPADLPPIENALAEFQRRAEEAERARRLAAMDPRTRAMTEMVGYPEPTEAEMRLALEAHFSMTERAFGSLGNANIRWINKDSCYPAAPRAGWACEYSIAFEYSSGNPGVGLIQMFGDAMMGGDAGFRSFGQFTYRNGYWSFRSLE
jgi:hypothetical protein